MDCITNTSGYDFRNAQVQKIRQASQARDFADLAAEARKITSRSPVLPLTFKRGRRVVTLIYQFDRALSRAGMIYNSHGDKYTLYSLRHFYAVQVLRRGVGVFDLARNMGTSVQIIQSYYGKHATPMKLATQLGG